MRLTASPPTRISASERERLPLFTCAACGHVTLALFLRDDGSWVCQGCRWGRIAGRR